LAGVLKPPNPNPKADLLSKPPPDEDVYRIHDSGLATVTPSSSDGVVPPTGAVGTPVAVSDPDPADLRLVTNSPQDQVLRLHLTDVPGWHATIDGQPLSLNPFSGIMMQARIPPGRHVIDLRYWPTTFSVGLALAAAAVVLLAGVPLVLALTRRRDKTGVPSGPESG
jgi:hypothetical protein